MLFLRTTDKDGKSHGGFQWPFEIGAIVEAPDWRNNTECGNGLHGLLNGEGDASHLSWENDAIWWAVEAENAVDLDGKHKFQRCVVRCFGDRKTVTDWLLANGCAGRAVHGASVTAGEYGTATAGAYGAATAGEYGTATAGYRGKAMAGDYGTATAGKRGKAMAGNRGKAMAGNRGKAMAGEGGTATAGDYGMATAGDYGTAMAGDYGTATAGDYGTATAGNYGTISIRYYDGRYRFAVGYVGEDGIEPNVAYRVKNGKLVQA